MTNLISVRLRSAALRAAFRRVAVVAAAFVIAVGMAPTDPDPALDFRLVVDYYGAGTTPLGRAELIAQGGRVIQITEGSKELILIEPAERRLELLDLDGGVLAQVTYSRIEEFVAQLRRSLIAKADSLDRKGGRSNHIAAEMSRALVEPRYNSTFNAKDRHLRLIAEHVEIDARGEPESDPARLELLRDVLTEIVKLGAFRNPENIPPYTRLDTIRKLIDDHKLRPADTTFLYRLAGPPAKYRWTYRLLPGLSKTDRELFVKVDRFRAQAKRMFFEEYAKR